MVWLSDGTGLYIQGCHITSMQHTNWDVLMHFYLMAYRATPIVTTGFSPFYLLHGRETPLPSTENVKAKVSRESPDHHRRLQNLKAGLKSAYKMVNKANRKSHLNNKRLRDRKAKLRKFEVRDLVYLYCPAMKPGLSRKFRKPWFRPYQNFRLELWYNRSERQEANCSCKQA